MFRVLKDEGILYLEIPDKRYTFDINRPSTPLEHLIADYEGKPLIPRIEHYKEWARNVIRLVNEEDIRRYAEEDMKNNYSIHFHVWTQTEVFEFLLYLKREYKLTFDMELMFKDKYGVITILRKTRHEKSLK